MAIQIEATEQDFSVVPFIFQYFLACLVPFPQVGIGTVSVFNNIKTNLFLIKFHDFVVHSR